MPTILCSCLQHIILAGFDLLQQVLNLLQCVGNGSCKCHFYPSITCVQAALPQFSNPTKPVLACSNCSIVFSLWFQPVWKDFVSKLSFSSGSSKCDGLGSLFCQPTSNRQPCALDWSGKAQLAQSVAPECPVAPYPRVQGFIPCQISCVDFFCSVCSFPNQPWDTKPLPCSAPGIWQARSHIALANPHPSREFEHLFCRVKWGQKKAEEPCPVLSRGAEGKGLCCRNLNSQSSKDHADFSQDVIKTLSFVQARVERTVFVLKIGNVEDCVAVPCPFCCHHLDAFKYA